MIEFQNLVVSVSIFEPDPFHLQRLLKNCVGSSEIIIDPILADARPIV